MFQGLGVRGPRRAVRHMAGEPKTSDGPPGALARASEMKERAIFCSAAPAAEGPEQRQLAREPVPRSRQSAWSAASGGRRQCAAHFIGIAAAGLDFARPPITSPSSGSCRRICRSPNEARGSASNRLHTSHCRAIQRPQGAVVGGIGGVFLEAERRRDKNEFSCPAPLQSASITAVVPAESKARTARRSTVRGDTPGRRPW